ASTGMDKGYLRAFLEEGGEAGSVDAAIEAEEARIYEEFETFEEQKNDRSGFTGWLKEQGDRLVELGKGAGNLWMGTGRQMDNWILGAGHEGVWDPLMESHHNLMEGREERQQHSNELISQWSKQLGGDDKIFVQRADGS